MKTIKRNLLTLVALLTMTAGAWAQNTSDEVTMNATANANEWTFTMPGFEIELEVEYYTQDEIDQINDVTNKINALPAAADVTTNNKADIEAARTAYDALGAEQKTEISAEVIEKLTAAEAALAVAKVKSAIDALPAAADVTASDKAAIEAARSSYNALSAEQKTAVGSDALAKLEADEVALEVVVINALPAAADVTTANKDAIEAARTAYDALTAEQKTAVGTDALEKLTAAEAALAVAEVKATINALPAADTVSENDKDAINAARAAYDALTTEQKAAFPADVLAKLTAAEAALAIASLPAAADVAASDKAAIEAARSSYNALSAEQKTAVGSDALAKLEADEVALEVVVINALPAAADVTTANKDAIEAARTAYDALTAEQKTAVGTDTLEKLTAAEAALAIVSLPAATDVTIADKDAIRAARAAYNALSDAQKETFPADVLAKLRAAELALGYEVTIPADEYVTFYMNENLTLDETETAAELYTITGVNQTTATASKFDVIPANVPLLVKNNSQETRTILLIPTENAPANFIYYEGFKGTLAATSIPASDTSTDSYAFNGKQFVWVKDNLAVGANKCWLEVSKSTSNARAISIVFSETTGISGITGNNGISGDWYDLNGRKLQSVPTKKGVYIQNGKKVVIK